ncbi:SRPBCC family protein [Rhabdobacter roseus]|uniref:Putative membrane protein n=1 Tax=Rhabdobacter roseus TaxID=1655419 RepID=A0A840TST0_9BACT|nr:SRPBCC family protein [Rhabdobacter roseus]MBB5283048.1 putative membrane protein [Rhabdobacter roseus]
MKKAYSTLMPRQRTNVGSTERIVSLFGGACLLYDALTKEDTSVVEALVGGYLIFRGATGYCPVHSAIEERPAREHSQNINIKTRLLVKRPRQEVYDFWRKLDNLPLFMNHLESVTVLNERESEWKAKVPGGLGTIGWRSEIVKEEPGRLLGWHSKPGAVIENGGKIEFSDLGEGGTEVQVVISYKAPLGVPGKEISRLLNPYFRDMVLEDILNFKNYLETNEVPAPREPLRYDGES